jgi:hypothetical protein
LAEKVKANLEEEKKRKQLEIQMAAKKAISPIMSSHILSA